MAERVRPISEETPEPVIDVTELIRKVEDDPKIIFTSEEAFEAYYSHIEQEALSVPVDLSTKAGRDKISSAAYSVARKKTTFDKTGKDLTEEYRKKTNTINAVRKFVTERFTSLQAQVRQPLTDWEEADKARKAEADRIIEDLTNAPRVMSDETRADIEARLERIRGINLNDEILGPRLEMATDLRDEAVKSLTETAARLKQQEEERDELERLRREAAEREARDRAEQEARKQQEAEERRVALETERREREKAEAAEQARREAEEMAERARQEELARIEREKQAEIDAANERARKAEADARAERDRIAQEQADKEAAQRKLLAEAEARRKYAQDLIDHIRMVGLGMIDGKSYPYGILIRELTDKIVIDDSLGDMQEQVRAIRDATLTSLRTAMERARERSEREAREAEEQRLAEEKTRRESNKKHQASVIAAAQKDIMACGIPDEQARALIAKIRAGEIRHVSISF